MYRQLGHRFGEAAALTNLGQVRYRLGDYQQATDDQAQAVALAREIGSPRVEAWALTRLSEVRCRQGLHEQAAGSYQQALELFREVADRDGEAEALNGSGENLRAAGQHGKARAVPRQRAHPHPADRRQARAGPRPDSGSARSATSRATMIKPPASTRRRWRSPRDRRPGRGSRGAQRRRGKLCWPPASPARHRTCHDTALTLARRTGDRYQQARAQHGLAQSLLRRRPARRRAPALAAGPGHLHRLGVPEAVAPPAVRPGRDGQGPGDFVTGAL